MGAHEETAAPLHRAPAEPPAAGPTAETADPPAEAADPFATGAGRPPAGGDPSGPPAFPIAGWERYQPVRFLGQGGMGRVFLARDPRLHRDVAIKLVRGDDPDLSRRLVQEARAQARVDHERVCKVYEVGEVSGHVYIAMQHIAGSPLGALAGELHLAEKVLVIREAALGVHEAHRAGIIHRDLKPSNILVERAEDGSLRPVLVDFGLARSLPEGTTATEGAVGTPHYMSPEQARGDTRSLDRRADVYSLGATLYQLLCGEPPIDGENTLDILSRIAAVEPRPLRAIDPRIPADLEAVVLKCLEKDRSLRYDSARALAADLDRFLNGEPVQARPSGLLYRLRKRVVRHRRLAAATAAALVAVVIAVGFGIKTRLDAAERERRARRFAEIVERIEAEARYSALAPLHDIRPDKLALRARMDELAAAIREADARSRGTGNYALGRGHLALDAREQAGEHLELAWKQGNHEPRVAYALAIVLGDLYQAERLGAERLQDRTQREARRREIERRYRDPALFYLGKAGGARVPSPRYVAARLASYEDRLDDALAELDAMGDGLPWFHEGAALRGSVLATRASRRWNAGDRAGAATDFEAGRRAYARAAAIGESVPSVHVAAAELEHGQMVMELYSSGEVGPPFERGMACVKRALTADPDHVAALFLQSRLARRMAEHRGNNGIADLALLRAAVSAAERAVAVAPGDVDARKLLGSAHWQWGQIQGARGQDPSEELQKAADIFEAIDPADRDYDFHLTLGLIFDVWADHQEQTGADPMPNRARSIDAYSAATASDEQPAFAWLNLGNAYLLRASSPRCKDPDGDLARSIPALEKALARNPEHAVAHFYAGEVHSFAARRARARGGDAGPDLARALEHYRKGLTIDPRQLFLHNGVGNALLEQAQDAWDRGEDPAPALRDARAAYEQIVKIAPEQGFGLMNVGEALTVAVDRAFAGGGDPRPAAALAIPELRRAIHDFPDAAPPRTNLGKVECLLAAYEFEQGRDPEKGLERALAALAEALQRNPEDGPAHRYVGEARATRALFHAKRGLFVPGDFEEAEKEHQRALEAAPEDQDIQIAFGHFWRARAEAERAAARGPGPALQRGLSLAEAVLAVRAQWADGRALRGSLRLVQAQLWTGVERRTAAARARADFEAAFASNPSLRPRWQARATLAQELSAP